MILVFASKRVGAELLRYLISRNDPIDRVIAASELDGDILNICRQSGIPCDVFSQAVVEQVVARGKRYDWLLDLWSPHILRKPLLDLARNRANLHPSLVPHARGADSTAWILRKGLLAGVSILEMTEVIDAGGLYAQQQIDIEFPMRGLALHEQLRDEMIALFRRSWPRMLSGELTATPQPPGGSHHRRKETNADRIRDGGTPMTIDEVVGWMLAHDFHPGTTAELERNGQRYRVRVLIEKVDA
jgi:methionyl-tRNA formyltransferase